MDIADAQKDLVLISKRKYERLYKLEDEKSLYAGKLDNNRSNYSMIEREITKSKIRRLLNIKGLILREKVKFKDSTDVLRSRIEYLEVLKSSLERRMREQVDHINSKEEEINKVYDEIRTISYYISKLEERMMVSKFLKREDAEIDDEQIEEYVENEREKELLRK